MNRKTIIAIIIILSCGFSNAQSTNELLRSGDEYYRRGDNTAAEEVYRKARMKESSLAANYNLGNSTYNLERYEEAVDHYMNATLKVSESETNSAIHYNLGNAYFNNQDLEKAIEAYKQAVRLDANNKEARYNLAVCKEMKKQAEQQQQEEQGEGEGDPQDQDQEDQEQQEGDQEQENKEQEENQEQQEQEDSESKQDSTQNQQGEPSAFDSTRLEKQTLDSMDAIKLLQIIQSEELKVQEKLRKFNSNRKKPNKDW